MLASAVWKQSKLYLNLCRMGSVRGTFFKNLT